MIKKVCSLTVSMLMLFYFMTATIGEAGGLGYELVIKPYPSLLKRIPNMEERVWEISVKNGEIPSWVVDKRYLSIASSDFESSTPIWEWFYMGINALFWVSMMSYLILGLYEGIQYVRRSLKN